MEGYRFLYNSLGDLEKTKKEYFYTNSDLDFLLIGESEKNKTLDFITRTSTVDSILSFNQNRYKDYKKIVLGNITDFTNDDSVFYKIFNNLIFEIKNIVKNENYFSIDNSKQNAVVVGILNSISSTNKLGITHGYLSMLSNLKYFLSQVDAVYGSSDLLTIKQNIYELSSEEKELLRTPPLVYEPLEKALRKLESNLLDEDLNYDSLPNPNTFFENSSIELKYSEFHKNFYTNPLLIKKYQQKDFCVYRILMKCIFSLLPLLGISLLRRNHIIYLQTKNIEDFYNITWETQFKESVEYERKKNC